MTFPSLIYPKEMVNVVFHSHERPLLTDDEWKTFIAYTKMPCEQNTPNIARAQPTPV